ncbi:MAG: hypothetical protein ABSH41_17055 [Syntrophobacteraceae bacterium]
MAALELAPAADYPAELIGAIKETVVRGVGFLLREQIQSGPYEGGMPGRIIGSGDATISAGADAPHIRIGYVQHALCAFLGYEKLLPAESAAVLEEGRFR